MATHYATQEVIDAILDLRRGLHMAMTKHIREQRYGEVEAILHQMDARMGALIDEKKPISRKPR